MKKHVIWRWAIYLTGVAVLAMGVTLGTKTGMGISPINAVAFSINKAFGVDFALATFCFYVALIILEFLIRGRHRRWRDLFQLPFSMVFSWLLGFFEGLLRVPEAAWQRWAVLLASIVLLGLGVCLMVNMRIAPNPADGMSDTIGWALKKDMGFGKNLLDFCCVIFAFTVDAVFGTMWTSIGITTIVSSIFIGRAVYLFNRLFQKKILRLAGLSTEY